jgi:glycosyltransferase involved in cell wall biosynthesis
MRNDPEQADPVWVLFDLYGSGHHRSYLEHLARYRASASVQGKLVVASTPEVFGQHPGFARWLDEQDPTRIGRHEVQGAHGLRVDTLNAAEILWNDRIHGKCLREVVRSLRPDHVVIMYMDSAKWSLAFGLRFGYPVRMAGILFRSPPPIAPSSDRSPRRRFTRWLKLAILSRALANPHLGCVLCPDPGGVELVGRLDRDVRAVLLPESIDTSHPRLDAQSVKERWGLSPDRFVALLFGSISERKGVLQTVSALTHLSTDSQHRMALVLAGRMVESERDRIEQLVSQQRAATHVQIIVDDRYIEEREIQSLFAAADVALLPYVGHVGSSNVLVRSASEGCPVIGPAEGFMGTTIRSNRLGLSIDVTDSRVLAGALESLVGSPGPARALDGYFSREDAARYAEGHTVDQFGRTVLGSLLQDAGRSAP